MLRAVVVLLVVLNLLFFGWARGWGGTAFPPPGASQREPERLTAQVRPERMQLLSPSSLQAAGPQHAAAQAASAPGSSTAPSPGPPAAGAPPAPAAAARLANVTAADDTLCLEAGPFTADQLLAANRALSRAGVGQSALVNVPVSLPGWLVYAGRFADPAARRTRLVAWQRQGLPATEALDTPRELAPGLVFSRHSSKADADAALAALTARHPAVTNVARVVKGPDGSVRLARLRAPAAAPALAQRLRETTLPQGMRFSRCAAA